MVQVELEKHVMFLWTAFKSHMWWNNAQRVGALTTTILPITASTYHGSNNFGPVIYAPETSTYQNIAKLLTQPRISSFIFVVVVNILCRRIQRQNQTQRPLESHNLINNRIYILAPSLDLSTGDMNQNSQWMSETGNSSTKNRIWNYIYWSFGRIK